jgi:hypothetical protein
MKKAKILVLILIFCVNVNGQFFNNYGLRIGAGLSNQYWQYKTKVYSRLTRWKNYSTGINGQVYAEKNLGKHFSLRHSIGYVQKGFTDNIVLSPAGEKDIATKDKLVLHDLSLDLSSKIIPIQKKIKPYLFIGLRGEYLMFYRDVIKDYEEDLKFNADLYDNFNKFTLGGLLGVGILYDDLLFLDFEYNPMITKNFESEGLAVTDKYFSLTAGLNINRLVKTKKCKTVDIQ